MKRLLLSILFILSLSSPANAALISRQTTWTDGQVLTHSALNSEFDEAFDEINGNLDEANLAATITFSDGDFLDLSAINMSSATEGLRIGGATSCSSATADGQLCWDTDSKMLRIGNGVSVSDWNMPDASIEDASPQLVWRDTTDDVAYSIHLDTTATTTGLAFFRGTKTSATGNFNTTGEPILEITSGDDVRVHYASDLIVDKLTSGGIVIGGGSGGALTTLGVASNGQLLIGDGAGSPTLAVPTAGDGMSITPGAGSLTFAVDSLGLKWEGGTSTEGTTINTSTEDIVTISSLSIPAATPILVVASLRKSTGHASGALVGLKVNAEQLFTEGTWSATTDAVDNGVFVAFIGARVTSYTAGGLGLVSQSLEGGAGFTSAIAGNLTPATVTDIVITGRVTNALNTMGVDEVHVYSLGVD